MKKFLDKLLGNDKPAVDIVRVKVQRPIATSGNKNEILAYIIDDDDEQISNGIFKIVTDEEIEHIMGDDCKAIWLATVAGGNAITLERRLE